MRILRLQLEKRKDRNKKEKQCERICNYKFWEPPSTLRKFLTTVIKSKNVVERSSILSYLNNILLS